MKKLGMFLMLLLAMTIGSHKAFAQSVTITMMPGWNWISVPLMDTLDFETALGSFTPMQGDIIKSQWSNATYMGNGQWRGPISQFYPGYGYMYYSNRPMPVMVTFTTQQPAPQVIVTTMEPIDITTNSAICGGNVASSNGDYVSITNRGICWGTNPNPTFNDNYVEVGNGLGSFAASMTELAPSTSYYVRAFAVTAKGTFYGEEESFTTDYAYVDFGLPSGTLWATCNIGADIPEDYGDYFAWGETQPKDTYDWSTYQYCNGSENTLTKYCYDSNYGNNEFTDNLTTLQSCDDAATANWGGDWRTPTREEWLELFINTTHTWTTQNEVKGWLITNSTGNSLFLPANSVDEGNDFEEIGMYWSSSLYDLSNFHPNKAWISWFDRSVFGISGDYRCNGLGVRPVRSAE